MKPDNFRSSEISRNLSAIGTISCAWWQPAFRSGLSSKQIATFYSFFFSYFAKSFSTASSLLPDQPRHHQPNRSHEYRYMGHVRSRCYLMSYLSSYISEPAIIVLVHLLAISTRCCTSQLHRTDGFPAISVEPRHVLPFPLSQSCQ